MWISTNPVRTLIKRGTPSTQVSLIIVVTREPLQSMWERAVLIKGIVCTYRNGPRIRLKLDRAIVARRNGRNSSFMQFESISSQRMTANLKCGISVASFRSINRVSNELNQKSSHPQLELWHTECPRGRKQPCSLHLMGPFSVETRCLSLFIRPQQRLQLCESDRVTRHGRRFYPCIAAIPGKKEFPLLTSLWPSPSRGREVHHKAISLENQGNAFPHLPSFSPLVRSNCPLHHQWTLIKLIKLTIVARKKKKKQEILPALLHEYHIHNFSFAQTKPKKVDQDWQSEFVPVPRANPPLPLIRAQQCVY